MYTPQERESIKIVLEDLEDLYSEFGGFFYKGSKLRKASATLNMLLIENELLMAYKLLFGKESSPIITAPNLDLYLDSDRENKIVCGIAGGATFVFSIISLIILGGKRELSYQPEYPPEEYKLNLSKYLEGSSFYFDKTRISRKMVVSYIANKRGGKHIDYRRKTNSKDSIYKILDSRGEFFCFDEKTGLYVELHSIIQALQKSRDIQDFIIKAKNLEWNKQSK